MNTEDQAPVRPFDEGCICPTHGYTEGCSVHERIIVRRVPAPEETVETTEECPECGHMMHLAENCGTRWSGRQADGQDVTVWCECAFEPPAPEPAGEAEERCQRWNMRPRSGPVQCDQRPGHKYRHVAEYGEGHNIWWEDGDFGDSAVAPSSGTPGLTEAEYPQVRRQAASNTWVVKYRFDGAWLNYYVPPEVQHVLAAEARRPLEQALQAAHGEITQLLEVNADISEASSHEADRAEKAEQALREAEARIAAQSALLGARDHWLARAEAAEVALEDVRSVLGVIRYHESVETDGCSWCAEIAMRALGAVGGAEE